MNLETNTDEGLKGLLEAMVDHSDLYDFVLVLKNPFAVPEYHYNCKLFCGTMSAESATALFNECFRIQPTEDIYQEALASLTGILQGDSTVEALELIKLIATTLIKILQNHLMLNMNAHLSRDGDEIFIKLNASEDNLKVQADLMDYRLQLKADPADTRPFQEVPPYGPFEKQAGTKTKLLNLPDKPAPELYFKKYDIAGTEVRQGSLFRQVDRIRIIHRMIFSVVDLAELTSRGVLLAAYPLHNNGKCDTLNSEWLKISNIVKSQDLQGVRSYFGEKIAMYFA